MPIVRGVDLAVARGEFVALLGPNGAGKSTLVKAIAGLVRSIPARVRLAGADITAAPAHEKVRHGLAFVPQTENIFATLTVHENLAARRRHPAARATGAERIAALYAIFPDLAARPGRRAGALSGGQRQMLAVARALVVEPAVLILDEPSAGLSPRVVVEVFDASRRSTPAASPSCSSSRTSRAALAIADRAVMLVEGRVAHEGPAATLADDPIIGELYLGARREARPPA